MELHNISVFVALNVFGDRSEGFKQTDRDRDAVVAVLADLVESGVQYVGKGNSADDNSQTAFVVAAIRRGQLSLRQSPQRCAQAIDAIHCRERVVDTRRKGADGDFHQFFNRTFNILSRCTADADDDRFVQRRGQITRIRIFGRRLATRPNVRQR